MKVAEEPVTADGGSWAKVAVTFLVAPPASTTQVPVPEHPSPDQPTKVELPEEIAESKPVCPSVKKPTQTPPQSRPFGSLTTEPAPVPAFLTLTGCWEVKCAVTVGLPSTTTSQGPPWFLRAPDQPVKLE